MTRGRSIALAVAAGAVGLGLVLRLVVAGGSTEAHTHQLTGDPRGLFIVTGAVVVFLALWVVRTLAGPDTSVVAEKMRRRAPPSDPPDEILRPARDADADGAEVRSEDMENKEEPAVADEGGSADTDADAESATSDPAPESAPAG